MVRRCLEQCGLAFKLCPPLQVNGPRRGRPDWPPCSGCSRWLREPGCTVSAPLQSLSRRPCDLLDDHSSTRSWHFARGGSNRPPERPLSRSASGYSRPTAISKGSFWLPDAWTRLAGTSLTGCCRSWPPGTGQERSRTSESSWVSGLRNGGARRHRPCHRDQAAARQHALSSSTGLLSWRESGLCSLVLCASATLDDQTGGESFVISCADNSGLTINAVLR